jgi:hypothetical protein
MNMNGQQLTVEEQLQQLRGELNDAHLVIGQQQMMLQRLNNAYQQQQQSMLAMQSQLETVEEEVT